MQSDPQSRTAQLKLAEQVTELVHGAAALESAQRISKALFGGDVQVLKETDLKQLAQDGLDCTRSAGTVLSVTLADAGLAPSLSRARNLVRSKGVSINGQIQDDPERDLDFGDALFNTYYLIRRGKRKWHMVVRPEAALLAVSSAAPRVSVRTSMPCGGLTKIGKECKKLVKGGGRCHLHRVA